VQLPLNLWCSQVAKNSVESIVPYLGELVHMICNWRVVQVHFNPKHSYSFTASNFPPGKYEKLKLSLSARILVEIQATSLTGGSMNYREKREKELHKPVCLRMTCSPGHILLIYSCNLKYVEWFASYSTPIQPTKFCTGLHSRMWHVPETYSMHSSLQEEN